MHCLDYADFERYRAGKLDDKTGRTVQEHVSDCESCRARLAEVDQNLALFATLEPGPVDHAPERIGAYRIEREIGRGGMGVVYLARQQNPDRRVALKVLRRDMDDLRARRRFEYESYVLGRLRHAGIARVYEAGVASEAGHDSRPPGAPGAATAWFAMEYIDGPRIDDYVRTNNLDERSTLELLARIAEAVHHAHLRGVIHRDLKPGNILVESARPGEGASEQAQPKILDFGISRALDTESVSATLCTETGQILGTIPFMSPEQIGDEPLAVDVRSDIYALGVTGFLLLARELPIDVKGMSLVAAAQRIRDEAPARLRDKAPHVGADVETILAKALEKDPSRRYQSASELAADIRRCLSGDPIQARPASAFYTFRRTVARHRLPFALSAGFAVALVAFSITMSVLFTRARAAERLAAREAETAERTSAFLLNSFQASFPSEHLGDVPTAREVLESGAAQIERDLADEPLVAANLMHLMGRAFDELGDIDQARTLLTGALERRVAHPDTDPLLIAENRNDLGLLEAHAGNVARAIKEYEQALSIQTAVSGETDPAVATSLNNLGASAYRIGEYERAETYFRRALSIRRDLYGTNPHDELTESLNNLAESLRIQERGKEAEPLIREAIENLRTMHGDLHPNLASSRLVLCNLLLSQGKSEEAMFEAEAALAMRRRIFGDDHQSLANAWYNIGRVHENGEAWKPAAESYEHAARIGAATLPAEHPLQASNLFALGRALRHLDDDEAAREKLEEALAISRKARGPDHGNTKQIEEEIRQLR